MTPEFSVPANKRFAHRIDYVFTDKRRHSLSHSISPVKAGGMRITQNKVPGAVERPAKDQEDCTGLTNAPNINSEVVSGAPIKGHSDYPEEAVKATHAFKPVQNVQHKPQPHIQQPRK